MDGKEAMRLPMVCVQCMRDDESSVQIISSIEFRNDGRYEVTCPMGHKSLTILQEQKFEILFDIGGYAIIDGYYREAVSSFSSSLEMFYEFFVKAALREKGIDERELSAAWRQVSRQSERQLGAFVLLYTSELASSPILLSNDKVNFRNDVVHRGRIPSQKEAMEYGQAVLDVMRPVLKQAKEKYPKGTSKTIFQHLKECRGASKDGRQVATMTVSTIISLAVAEPGHDERSIEEAIAGLKRWV